MIFTDPETSSGGGGRDCHELVSESHSDELDAGISEVLLGTLLHTIEETGKGQLIFTSHNLRPLEVLSKDNIVFTTTNPSNR